MRRLALPLAGASGSRSEEVGLVSAGFFFALVVFFAVFLGAASTAAGFVAFFAAGFVAVLVTFFFAAGFAVFFAAFLGAFLAAFFAAGFAAFLTAFFLAVVFTAFFFAAGLAAFFLETAGLAAFFFALAAGFLAALALDLAADFLAEDLDGGIRLVAIEAKCLDTIQLFCGLARISACGRNENAQQDSVKSILTNSFIHCFYGHSWENVRSGHKNAEISSFPVSNHLISPYLEASDMMTLTPKATEELEKLLAGRPDKPPGAGLRLAVHRGGCAGWQYEMKVAGPEEGDVTIESNGARLIVAGDSIDRLKGCSVDYSDDLTDAGFKIQNPNASRACGCGTSFESTDEPPGAHAVPDGEACGDS